jgi:hypothetical protein
MPKSPLHKKKGSKASRSKGKAPDVEADDESMSINSLEFDDSPNGGGDNDSKSYYEKPMEFPEAPKIIHALWKRFGIKQITQTNLGFANAFAKHGKA